MFVTLGLNYYKQGDDLAYHSEHSQDSIIALQDHAEQLRSVADHLDKVVSVCVKFEDIPKINAGTHHIDLEVLVDQTLFVSHTQSKWHFFSIIICSEELGDKLLEENLVEKYPFDEED